MGFAYNARTKAAPYAGLTPDRMLDALNAIGLRPDGRLLALNSYENRVYQIWMEEGPPLVAKFYRPESWSDAQIGEEHAFAGELAGAEIPVIAPLAIAERTLHEFEGFRFAVFPRRGGRPPELEDPDTLEWIGRFIGRIHAVGASHAFRERTVLDIYSHGLNGDDLLYVLDRMAPGIAFTTFCSALALYRAESGAPGYALIPAAARGRA